MNNEEQLFIEDTASSRSSSHSDLSDSESYGKHCDESTNFNSLYYSKQVETLKNLRHILNENKILKKRLNLVESELEQYQEFKGVFPLKDLNAELDETNRSMSEIDESLLKTTDDKESQTDTIEIPNIPIVTQYQAPKEKTPNEKTILIIEEKTLLIKEEPEPVKPTAFVRQPPTQFLKSTIIELASQSSETDPKIKTLSPKPDEEIKPKNKKSKSENELKEEADAEAKLMIIKTETESQTDNAILYVQQINELRNEIESIRKEKEDELAAVNMANLELKIEIENLKRNNEAINRDYEAISEKFNDFRLNNMDSEHELQLLSTKNVEIQYEYEQLIKVVTNKENQLLIKENEIELLKENNRMLKESGKLIEEQQKQIEYLLAENEKHLKEKHVVCQQKITELTNECNSYAEFIKTQNIEMKSQLDLISQLNLEIEKLKIDQQSFNFKEFVNLKREVNFLKQEKERAFANEVIAQPNSISNAVVLAQQPLPPIKESKRSLFKFFN
jgi:hypothetical protein